MTYITDVILIVFVSVFDFFLKLETTLNVILSSDYIYIYIQ